MDCFYLFIIVLQRTGWPLQVSSTVFFRLCFMWSLFTLQLQDWARFLIECMPVLVFHSFRCSQLSCIYVFYLFIDTQCTSESLSKPQCIYHTIIYCLHSTCLILIKVVSYKDPKPWSSPSPVFTWDLYGDARGYHGGALSSDTTCFHLMSETLLCSVIAKA